LVVGFDNLNDYYDRRLKEDRHAILSTCQEFQAVVGQLDDMQALSRAAALADPDYILHFAAQVGVRHSRENPRAYVESNIVGSINLFEVAKETRPKHLLLASTSSVYGGNKTLPSCEIERADFPITPYAATKRAMEVMAHSYSHLSGLPTTCFRLFTVYGPWGRPDTSLFRFVDAIQAGRPIEIYGMGEMRRDFTYVNDLVEAIARLLDRPPSIGEPATFYGGLDTLSPVAPWRVVNIAGGRPVPLLEFVEAIEFALGRRAEKVLLPMQPGDVRETFADYRLLEALTGYRPETPLSVGVPAFVEWYLSR
jgi:UDP-glucuronate 4-epimerase